MWLRIRLKPSIAEIKSEKDLLPPGAEPGTIPTDLEQATGLERLEILGKMQGIDVFDMSPLPSDRTGASFDLGQKRRIYTRTIGRKGILG
jgi:cytochrome c oxidase subunit 5b